MKTNTKRKFFTLLLSVGLLLTLSVSAYAHEIPDKNRTGSITVEMQYNGNPVNGGKSEIYRVGEISENNGDYGFVKTAEFQSFNETLEDLQSPELAEKLANHADLHHIPAVRSGKAENGKLVFGDLELGLYLVVQTKAAEGYNLMKPFLVSVPFYEAGAYRYDVNAYGKFELEKTPEPTKPQQPRLPQTGQLNWPVPVLAVSGMILFAAGWILRFCRKKEHYET